MAFLPFCMFVSLCAHVYRNRREIWTSYSVSLHLIPLSQGLSLTLQRTVLAGQATSIRGESPVSASQDLPSLLKVLFMGVGDSNSGLHGCAPSALPTQHISPDPDSDVVKNEDCSLGCLWSQRIQNVWGRL